MNEKDLKNESHIIIAADNQKILIFRTNFFSGRMLSKQLTTKIIIFRAYFFSGRMDERPSTICSGEIIYYNNTFDSLRRRKNSETEILLKGAIKIISIQTICEGYSILFLVK